MKKTFTILVTVDDSDDIITEKSLEESLGGADQVLRIDVHEGAWMFGKEACLAHAELTR